jgi:hypothetical protein
VTNLPTLFSLVSALPQEQLLYYQAGIGTPIVQSTGFPGFLSRARARLAAILDDGLAWSLASVRSFSSILAGEGIVLTKVGPEIAHPTRVPISDEREWP